VDLAEVASDLRGTLRPLTRPGVELHVEVDAVPPIETDRVLLTHVLRNLLVNAVKYTVKGSVTLSVRQIAAHEVDLIVADTGIGIAPEDRSRVFEEFYQVRGALQADRKGTGLGLPYARRVTETLGGRLTLESEVGRGSTFTVNLPTTWQPLLMGKSPGRRTTAAVHAGTVLIVDDDDSFRTALRGMLQGLAGEVLEAQNGTTGLAMMRSARPDVAFLDLRMPDLDGSEVLAQMTADPELRGIRVVIVTSADLTASAKITLGAATAILAKSNVDRNAVAAVLDEALSAAKSSG
ncbi:MAG TPA: hybrid sensor histidine kinase/response regulator, partial [Candidatus Elarobacter sp.]